jgi:hypothetical protein
MRRMISEYGRVFEIPGETKDNVLIARIFTFIVLLFILGFLVENFLLSML